MERPLHCGHQISLLLPPGFGKIQVTWLGQHFFIEFSFLIFSDETQMDPFNLAICFGPSLCPIPDNKDLVQHTNLVNDLIKNFIIYCHEIFNFPIDGPVYM